MIITHGDLDGLVSALIALEMSGHKSNNVHFFSYGRDRDEKWEELLRSSLIPGKNFGDVWFVDISLNPGELEWARCSKIASWLWVDHHDSSKRFDPKGIFDEVHLDVSGERCAADILWYLYLDRDETTEPEGVETTKHLEKWVGVAHDRDLWINNKHERNMKLDMILKEHIRRNIVQELVFCCRNQSPNQVLHTYSRMWQSGMKSFENSLSTAQNTAYLFDGDPPVHICWVTGYQSDVSNYLYLNDREIIVLLQAFPDNVGISFRTRRDDVEVNKIAESFGGGGHPQSAGGKLKGYHLIKGYEAIYEDIAASITEQGYEEANKI
jgi:oligoribonuclease NrnB/cAMP/cGMP phosphodiesterase (DHH superfamily)